jgi:transposase
VIRGLLTDAEWALLAPFLAGGSQGGRPARDHRLVLDAIFWIARTGAPWRDLPPELGNWNSAFRQYRRWTAAGLWDVILGALAGSDPGANAMQMIDSTIVRAHHQAAGGKGGFRLKLLAVHAAVSRARSTSVPTPKAKRSASRSRRARTTTSPPTTR